MMNDMNKIISLDIIGIVHIIKLYIMTAISQLNVPDK